GSALRAVTRKVDVDALAEARQLKGLARFVRADVADHRGKEVPEATPLVVSRPYQLQLRIATDERGVVILDTLPVVIEDALWQDDGLWLDFGVSAIDFKVDGPAVQSIWLPRRAASQVATFVIRAPEVGVNVLRFTLFNNDNVVQSYRFAAVVASDLTHA